MCEHLQCTVKCKARTKGKPTECCAQQYLQPHTQINTGTWWQWTSYMYYMQSLTKDIFNCIWLPHAGTLPDMQQNPTHLGLYKNMWQNPTQLGLYKNMWQNPTQLRLYKNMWQNPTQLGLYKSMWQTPHSWDCTRTCDKNHSNRDSITTCTCHK